MIDASLEMYKELVSLSVTSKSVTGTPKQGRLLPCQDKIHHFDFSILMVVNVKNCWYLTFFYVHRMCIKWKLIKLHRKSNVNFWENNFLNFSPSFGQPKSKVIWQEKRVRFALTEGWARGSSLLILVHSGRVWWGGAAQDEINQLQFWFFLSFLCDFGKVIFQHWVNFFFPWEDETVHVYFEFQCLLSGWNKVIEHIMRTHNVLHIKMRLKSYKDVSLLLLLKYATVLTFSGSTKNK